MIALLLSIITSLYCTSLTIGFYSEVVVTIRAHFVLSMVIINGLDLINQTSLYTCFAYLSIHYLSAPLLSLLTLCIPSMLSHTSLTSAQLSCTSRSHCWRHEDWLQHVQSISRCEINNTAGEAECRVLLHLGRYAWDRHIWPYRGLLPHTEPEIWDNSSRQGACTRI